MQEVLETARAIIQGMPDAALLLDRSRHCISYNDAFVRLAGLTPKKLERLLNKGTPALSIVTHDAASDRERAEECLKEAKPIHLVDIAMHNPAGDELTVMQSFVPVYNGTDVVGLIVSLRDMTAEVRMHERYKALLGRERVRAEELERQVQERTREVNLALEEVTRLSRVDPLTGALNRRAFTDQAEQALLIADRHRANLGILMCDLDHFKRLNDTFGHQAGDKTLQATANHLGSVLRSRDLLARFGGEEFVILVWNADEKSAQSVADRCRSAIRDLPLAEIVPGKDRPQTMSVGLSLFPRDGSTLDDLVRCADKALYQAKRSGRDRSVVYNPGLKSEIALVDPRLRRPRVMIVDVDADRARTYSKMLAKKCDVVCADSGTRALAYCARQPFDALIADENVGTESGVEFLRKTIPFLPGALRILLLSATDVYMTIRGTNSARVDHFLLRRDADDHLVRAVHDGLLRRDLIRQELGRGDQDHAVVDADTISTIEDLIASRGLFVAYQPIVRADTHEIFAYEALTRMHKRVFPHPGILFDTAVQVGAVIPLGRLVREMIAIDMQSLAVKPLIFVNLHPEEIEDDLLLEGVPFSGKLGERVVFEVTERASIVDLVRFQERVNQLKELGCRVAVDDLGAGYAALNSVALLGPEFVKIDMTLIRNVQSSSRKQRLVQSIVNFARAEEIQVVAEGIETEEEARVVIDLGCDLLQGYHFGRPEPVAKRTMLDSAQGEGSSSGHTTTRPKRPTRPSEVISA